MVPFFPAWLSHQPTAALAPSHGPGWGWESHVRAGVVPLAAWELGARGVGESEGVGRVAAPLCCRHGENRGIIDAHMHLHLGMREERAGILLEGLGEQNLLLWSK